MSDFGTMIDVMRRDGANTSERDRAALDQAIRPLAASGEHTDFTANPFVFRVGESRSLEGTQGLHVLLSEYWLDDEGGGFEPDELLESDERSAQAVLEALSEALGPDYRLELIADHW